MNIFQVPNDALLQTAFQTYKPSAQSMALRSEKNRRIVAEKFYDENLPPLSTLSLKVIASNYKVHPISFNIKPIQLRAFCDNMDANLPLEQCLDIVDEHYWKRFYTLKCSDNIQLNKLKKQSNFSWKNHSVTLLYVELIENTPFETWIPDKMNEITKSVSPYITELNIRKLQPIRKSHLERDLEEESATSQKEQLIENMNELPIEDCHHVDLSIIKDLINLNSMTLEIIPPILGTTYKNRYFNFSYVDIQNLSSGLSELKNLKEFKIRRSRMDCKKLSIILKSLEEIHLEVLQLYFCQLDDNCGNSLFQFLVSVESLKHLDLTGNYFESSAVDFISRGIQNSKITYLCLSHNPISDESLCKLTTSLQTCSQLKNLKLSAIKSSKQGTSYIADLLKNHMTLMQLELIATVIDGNILIKALEYNTKIQQLFCQGCGISLEEELKIDLLLKRNRFIMENPYIGDTTKTENEIKEFINRTKNPILVKAKAIKSQHNECFKSKTRSSMKRLEGFIYKDLNKYFSLFDQKETNFFWETELNQKQINGLSIN